MKLGLKQFANLTHFLKKDIMVWVRKSYFAGFYEKFIKLKGKILVSTCKIAYKNFTEPIF